MEEEEEEESFDLLDSSFSSNAGGTLMSSIPKSLSGFFWEERKSKENDLSIFGTPNFLLFLF